MWHEGHLGTFVGKRIILNEPTPEKSADKARVTSFLLLARVFLFVLMVCAVSHGKS